MIATRRVLAVPSTLTREIRKSRFSASARRIGSVEDAFAWIAAVRDAAATHNCWAYRFGSQYRFGDDGEPAGSAGKPILQAIDGQGLDQTAVVVTRWFGGIKLGIGGLARAYGGSAAECLRAAAKTALVEATVVEFFLPFAALPLLQSRAADLGMQKLHETFDSGGARVRLSLPADNVDALRRLLADATRGRSAVTIVD